MIRKVFHIPDMQCPSCVMHVESIEDKLPGIREASASYRKQELVVEFDEEKITEEEILVALRNLGYPASIR
jgi:copper chaperone CopZ